MGGAIQSLQRSQQAPVMVQLNTHDGHFKTSIIYIKIRTTFPFEQLRCPHGVPIDQERFCQRISSPIRLFSEYRCCCRYNYKQAWIFFLCFQHHPSQAPPVHLVEHTFSIAEVRSSGPMIPAAAAAATAVSWSSHWCTC